MRLMLLLLAAGLLCSCRPAAAPVSAAPGVQQQTVLARAAQLRDGDLVFRRGRDLMSSLVLHQDRQSRFSHVGMVMREGGQVLVIHAMPDEPGRAGGVRLETLARFLDPAVARDAASYRLPGVDPARLRPWLQAQIGRPFDMRFAFSDAQALYCSELVLRGLHVAGQPLVAETVRAPLLEEPVITPDALRRLPGLQLLAGE